MRMTVRLSDPPSQQGIEKRSGPRVAMALPILLAWGGARHSALLRNLSTAGAMIETSVPLIIGNKIELHCGSIRADGIVLWQGAITFGIEFAEPIDDEQVTEQILRAEAVTDWRRGRALGAPRAGS